MVVRARLGQAIAAAALVGLVAAGLSGCTASDDPAQVLPTQKNSTLNRDVQKKLEDSVEAAMKADGATGAIVGVWAPWSGSWTAGIGTTTTGGHTRMSPDMAFRVGGNTEPMTCTVLLGLVDDHKVSLSDTVSKYLPQMVGVDGVTLGQLCKETSGIGDFTAGLRQQFVTNPTRPWLPLELVSDGLSERDEGETGTETWSASEPGYVLLGMALQAATKKSWSKLYEHYVFKPAGMADSSFPEAMALPSPSPHGYALALDDAGKQVCAQTVDVTRLSPSQAWTAGGVVSTVDDLKSFAQALASGSLVSSSSRKKQWTAVANPEGTPEWYKHVLGAAEYGSLRGYDGMIPGFLSAMMVDPTSGLTVVVMLNNSSNGRQFARALALQLAAIAATAPASGGKDAPKISLPVTAEQAGDIMKKSTVCTPEQRTPPTKTPAPKDKTAPKKKSSTKK